VKKRRPLAVTNIFMPDFRHAHFSFRLVPSPQANPRLEIYKSDNLGPEIVTFINFQREGFGVQKSEKVTPIPENRRLFLARVEKVGKVGKVGQFFTFPTTFSLFRPLFRKSAQEIGNREVFPKSGSLFAKLGSLFAFPRDFPVFRSPNLKSLPKVGKVVQVGKKSGQNRPFLEKT